MVRAKGKTDASTNRSGGAPVASESVLTKDSSEMENDVETGVFVETAVTEQTAVTVVAEEENNVAEAENLEEENDGAEEVVEEKNDGSEEEHDGAELESLEGELAKNEDYIENEVAGGDEACTADKKAEDASGNDEGTKQENTNQQEGVKQSVGMEKNENEINANNKEKVEGSSKEKTKRSRKRNNNRKRKANGTPQEKGEDKQVQKKVASIGKGEKDLGKLVSKAVEPSSKKVAYEDKSRVARKDIDLEGKDEPESSRKKSSAKMKANSMGMIFICNSETKKDCYRYKVLGLPANKKETVEKIYKGMRLFLYDIDLKLMYGIYKAAGRGGCNIQPKAFNSQFPSQVRFTVLEDCLPLAEETFRQAIKNNYYTRSKFRCQLSSEQVKDLCKLFKTAVKGSRSNETQLRLETNVVPKRDRAKRHGLDESRRPDRARQFEQVEDRRYREQVEDRRYREQAEDRRYREQAEDRLYREQVEDRGYREHPHLHGRGLNTSTLIPLAPLRPLPPLVQSYAYNRTLGRDPYGRDTVIQHNDSYRQRRLVELADPYRRDTVIGNPDVHRGRALLESHDLYRREGISEPREYRQPLNLETRLQVAGGFNDSYVPYRERLSYHDPPVNSVRSQPEFNPPPAGLRSEYLHGGTSTVFSSARSMLPEYPSSSAGPLYGHPHRREHRF
ncbi:uncharacterized protein LOC107023654 [Solanum pennellii]|uniref:Uncharacterized protein LOC107023654 n=1 Tax=Solanum pennellii TaxID=28526 RepID=A0ABM1H3N2_SOLPN|nr:uncharacterized protein LOC107023654 [Solanum pennellii]XP_015079899.1 uncharacterized protein LOC107023654 [Solanum pennellii]